MVCFWGIRKRGRRGGPFNDKGSMEQLRVCICPRVFIKEAHKMASPTATALRATCRAVLTCKPSQERADCRVGLGAAGISLSNSALPIMPEIPTPRDEGFTHLTPIKCKHHGGRSHKSCKPLCEFIRFPPFYPAQWEGWGWVENASLWPWVWQAQWECLKVGPVWLTPQGWLSCQCECGGQYCAHNSLCVWGQQ